ncbi:50S ribosomal protein L22 [Candidatus Peregrinibacteria bacterium]|nr:50S ribosomal protein L22 [Candidatus Peregrinibacteria bacterium]
MKAIIRQVRIAPKKAEIIAGLVKNTSVKSALDRLKFTPKKAAKIFYKVIHSAASNATHNFKQNIDDLVISEIYVTEGPTYKRSMPVSRGRTHPILKRTSHIVVKLNVKAEKEPKKL